MSARTEGVVELQDECAYVCVGFGGEEDGDVIAFVDSLDGLDEDVGLEGFGEDVQGREGRWMVGHGLRVR